MDPLYLSVLVSAEKKFWRCVQSGEAPHLINAEPPRPRIEAIRIVDMSSSNSWAEFAALFRNTREAFLDHERAKSELKALMPEDAKEAIGHGVRAKRSKSGAVSFDVLETEAGPCPGPVNRSRRWPRRLAKAQAELVNPEKSLTATIRRRTARRRRAQLPLCAACERARHRAQDAGPARDRDRADHGHRPGGRHGQSDHHAGARLRRMDRLGLAGLPGGRDRQSRSAWARL